MKYKAITKFLLLYTYPISTHFSIVGEGEKLITTFLVVFNLYIYIKQTYFIHGNIYTCIVIVFVKDVLLLLSI